MSRNMVDSGVEWIGKIPSDWKCTKLKNVCNCFGRIGFRGYTVEDLVDEGCGAITLSPTNIVDSKLNLSKCSYISWDKYYESPEIMVSKGDVILVKTASVGKCAIFTSDQLATINPQFVVFKNLCCSNRFLYYNLQCDYIQKQIKLSCMGSVIPTLTQGEILSYRIPMPSISVQETICDVLDEKCSAIDDVLAKTQESIEEYKKLKQAVITEAVTKGVRGKRPMKDSGIDWIGLIPKEWNIVKITRILDVTHPYAIGDGDHGLVGPDDYVDEGIPYIRVQNLGWGTEISSKGMVYISKETNQKIEGSTLRPGDVLFAKTGATIGKTGIIPDDFGIANTTSHVGKITVAKNVCSKYIMYTLASTIGYKQFWDIASQKSTRPELAINEIKAMKVLLPYGFEEQQEIADYLDKKCAAIDILISKKQQFIEELTAYKKSLIYEYVTGKKEVPA